MFRNNTNLLNSKTWHSVDSSSDFGCWLQWLTCFIFIGRGYQFYFFGAPYTAFFWDEGLLSPLISKVFQVDWNSYATSPVVNRIISLTIKLSAYFLILAGIIGLIWSRVKRFYISKIFLKMGIFILLFLGCCLFKDKNYDILQVFELSIQIASPLALLFYKPNRKSKIYLEVLKIACACTFMAHGFFALGLWYVPGHFIDMTIKLLSVNEQSARLFLTIVGAADFLASLLIFLNPRAAKIGYCYLVVWGLATACARVAAGYNSEIFWHSLHQSAYLTLYRLPHGLLPLALFYKWRNGIDQKNGSLSGWCIVKLGIIKN